MSSEIDLILLHAERANAIVNSVVRSNKAVAAGYQAFPFPIGYLAGAVMCKVGELHLNRTLLVYTLKFELLRRRK